ncbi:hypothetical protein [Novipirellula sp.]|uniref:hypothetical protein n=1 Tax=Novipirellula sp. TaxID=2795430 RepID=UPI0035661A81
MKYFLETHLKLSFYEMSSNGRCEIVVDSVTPRACVPPQRKAWSSKDWPIGITAEEWGNLQSRFETRSVLDIALNRLQANSTWLGVTSQAPFNDLLQEHVACGEIVSLSRCDDALTRLRRK